MIGLGQDFRIYKKRNTDWLNDEWDTVNGPSSEKTLGGTVRDMWYDFDGILMGISRFGLVKQENTYYLSNFKQYDDEIQNKVSLYKILYSSTGVKLFGNMDNNNNANNVFVDGKNSVSISLRILD